MENKPEALEQHHEGDAFTGATATPTDEPNAAVSSDGIVEKDHALSDSSHVENGKAGDLSPEHREYLIARHGNIDLNPVPTMDPADPLNWPAWKVLFSPKSCALLTMAEKHKPHPRCLQCNDDNLHSRCDHPRLRTILYRSGRVPHSSILPYEYSDPNLGICATLLETNIKSLWPSSNLADLYPWFYDLQYWLC